MSQNSMENSSVVRFNILVVDDDFTSLSIVSAMLKHWDYNVVTVRRPVEALVTIRILKNIDVVVTDLHMPEMNGVELQQQINEEFKNLPVMVMSSDDRESVIMNALASGVVFYIVKPLNPVDLKNVWQYAVASKKKRSIYYIDQQIGSFGEAAAGSSSVDDDDDDDDDNVSATSVNGQKKNRRDSNKKKALKNCRGEQQGESIMSAPKKAKVAWTNSLHNRFLRAIKYLTLEKAVPKKILEVMNVPGLKRENVASHLQKYRLFLKRVAERGSSKNFRHRSSFAAAHSSMMLQEEEEYAKFREMQQQQQEMMGSSPYLPGYGGGLLSLNGSLLSFPSLGASSSNSVSQLGLLGNEANNLPLSFFGNTANTLYHQSNPGTNFGSGSNDMGENSLSYGGLSAGLMNSTDLNQMHQQESQSRPDPNFKGFGRTSAWNPGHTSGLLEDFGIINNRNPFPNYAGIQQNDDRERVASGEMINGTAAGPTGNNATVHHFAPAAAAESSSSAGLAINANRLSPLALLAGGGANNEQGNTSVLPPLSSSHHQRLLINSDVMMNNAAASVDGNATQLEQFGDEDMGIDNFLLDPSDYQFLFQEQGEDCALNANSVTVTDQAQLNLPTNQSQNPDLSILFATGGDNAPSPWNEPTPEQLHEIEQILSQEFSRNAANAHPSDEYYHPSFDQNTDQPQEGNQNNLINSVLNRQNPPDNTPSGNQGWDDEFIDSLFENDSF